MNIELERAQNELNAAAAGRETNSRSVQWRSWAIQQAIALHGHNGSTTDVVIGEARKLLAFVAGDEGSP